MKFFIEKETVVQGWALNFGQFTRKSLVATDWGTKT